ncbi:hypothetical protein DPMN_079556 [Dreissena polymorpha]|uniref:Uncharacterized protein n=1 Tax=Dreissena polymorpha TaxID=45954 RepID=A0A9D3YSS8_DREPO|nr:hypothetical protein DPMN_079556 [Dreissena polymorpha]
MDLTLLQANNVTWLSNVTLNVTSSSDADIGYLTTMRFLLFPLAVGLSFAIGLGCNIIRRRCSGESGYDLVDYL